MKTIHKYRLDVTDFQTVTLPYGSQILTVQVQHGTPCLWVLIYDTEAKLYYRKIVTVGTGNPMPEGNLHYIGTYQFGVLVFHVFEDIAAIKESEANP